MARLGLIQGMEHSQRFWGRGTVVRSRSKTLVWVWGLTPPEAEMFCEWVH